jgi:hypothetical protein
VARDGADMRAAAAAVLWFSQVVGYPNRAKEVGAVLC